MELWNMELRQMISIAVESNCVIPVPIKFFLLLIFKASVVYILSFRKTAQFIPGQGSEGWPSNLNEDRQEEKVQELKWQKPCTNIRKELTICKVFKKISKVIKRYREFMLLEKYSIFSNNTKKFSNYREDNLI